MHFDRKSLEAIGRRWVRYIKQEAKKDALKSTFMPRDRAFYESFSFAIEPNGIVAIYSTWPHLDIITKGTRGKFKMTWLTQEKGVDVVPLVQRDGSVVFRATPLNIGGAWIHPKIAKHTFIARAYERAVAEELDAALEKGMQDAATRKR
jgi:hypothetical protein